MAIEFRAAVPEDWKVIRQLNHEVIVSNLPYDAFLNPKFAQTPAGEKYYKEVTSRPEYLCFLAVDNGIPVGYIVGSKKNITYRTVKTLEINDMGVSSRYRSQGIGAKLISELKRRASDLGYQTLYVNAYVKNVRAIAFYKSQGFEPIDVSLEIGLT